MAGSCSDEVTTQNAGKTTPQRSITTLQIAPPGWRLERRGLDDAELWLTGDWIARESGLQNVAAVRQVLVL
jgi:hypothetical protein